MSRPICPRCDSVADKQKTQYGVRYECCGMWAWGEHPLADADTHAARRTAHEVFDTLWKGPTAKFSRSGAYKWLRNELRLTEAQCHMKVMDAATAKRVPLAVERIRAKLSLQKGNTNGA